MVSFYETLEHERGHILLLFVLILAGWTAAALQLPKAEDIVVGAFGALLGALKGHGNGKV